MCNEQCCFYSKIQTVEKGTVGQCFLFSILVKENAECHDEVKADEAERRESKKSPSKSPSST